MATTELHNVTRDPVARSVTTGSAGESLVGLGAAVLGILALLGILPFVLTAIAAIAVGAGFLLAGAALAGRHAAPATVAGATPEVSTGMSTEMVGGVAGVVLGILALLGETSWTLLSIAAIVFGATLVLGNGPASLSLVGMTDSSMDMDHRHAAAESARAAAGADLLVGIGVIALGILALLGVSMFTLVEVAMLATGVALLLTGGVLTSRMATIAS